MSSRQSRAKYPNVYIYRPFDPDPERVTDYRNRWMAAMINHHGFDIGTKKRPKGTPEQRAEIVAGARVVLEALGLLPDYFEANNDYVEPGPEVEETTRPEPSGDCTHMKCRTCERCFCDGIRVQKNECAECRWKREGKQRSGQHATTAVKDLSAHD